MSATRRKFIHQLGLGAASATLLPFGGSATETKAPRGFHRVLSCNVRVALPEDETKGVGWPQRKDICIQVIQNQQPDIVGFQEVLKVQAEDIREAFPRFCLFGFEGPEMDAHPTGYHGIAKNPILFNKERYELLTGGNYWLSETPLVAGSKSWNTARARHANWVRLKERKTGKELRIVNLHLDHISDEAKKQQARIVAEESAQYSTAFAQLLTGDFNSRFDSPVLASLRTSDWKESYETLHGQKEAGHTGHEFEGTAYTKAASKGRIDYIWYRGNIKPVESKIIKDALKGKFPSDHFFMLSDFEV
ncbi:endonuclease/exonuclease/phosphatase family protein [Niabella sp. CJ426]|uniref:endonuclease/exonuclease/phosphatase family protein n=1 Tax=Niabella sp. CJ426 TaxID=3393740 RepID=UPI003D00F0FA